MGKVASRYLGFILVLSLNIPLYSVGLKINSCLSQWNLTNFSFSLKKKLPYFCCTLLVSSLAWTSEGSYSSCTNSYQTKYWVLQPFVSQYIKILRVLSVPFSRNTFIHTKMVSEISPLKQRTSRNIFPETRRAAHNYYNCKVSAYLVDVERVGSFWKAGHANRAFLEVPFKRGKAFFPWNCSKIYRYVSEYVGYSFSASTSSFGHSRTVFSLGFWYFGALLGRHTNSRSRELSLPQLSSSASKIRQNINTRSQVKLTDNGLITGFKFTSACQLWYLCILDSRIGSQRIIFMWYFFF